MRLHHVLELYDRPGTPKSEYMDALKANYPHIAQFSFGAIDPIPEDEWKGLQLYSNELIGHDLFDLPFDLVAFSWSHTITGDKQDYLVVAQTLRDEKSGSDRPVLLDLWVFPRAGDAGAPIPLHGFMDFRACRDSGKIAATRPELMFPIRAGKGVAARSVDDLPGAERGFIEIICDFLALVVMLHANGVETRETAAPERLNKQRVKKGLPAIQSIREVFVRVGNRVVRPSGVEDGGRGHASPRCHWRRGHVRRLPEGRITNVRPCLVGTIAGAEPAPKEYVVRR